MADEDERERFDGYHECPCCGEILCGGFVDEPLCDSCAEAGCEESEDACGETNYWSCEIPRCPVCDTEQSFLNDKQWHSNCDDEKLCASVWEVEYHDLPAGVVALDLGHKGYRELKEMQHG